MRRSRQSKRPLHVAKTNWKRVDALTDAQIQRAVRHDPGAAPIADADWFRRARVVVPPGKKAISLRIDRDVLQWYQEQGQGYQTRINAVLRAYKEAQESLVR